MKFVTITLRICQLLVARKEIMATLAAWWAEIEQQRINNEWAKEITRRLEEGDRRKALFNR